MPVSKISTFGDRSRNAGGSRWIGQRSSPDGAGFSSIGSPITFHRRPSVPSPTGTEMGPPVSTTSIPRGRPSVESIATARTRSSPRCCCTSATSSPPSGRVIRSAEYTSGSRSGKTASTTTPLISTTLPTFLLLPFASIALLAWRNPPGRPGPAQSSRGRARRRAGSGRRGRPAAPSGRGRGRSAPGRPRRGSRAPTTAGPRRGRRGWPRARRRRPPRRARARRGGGAPPRAGAACPRPAAGPVPRAAPPAGAARARRPPSRPRGSPGSGRGAGRGSPARARRARRRRRARSTGARARTRSRRSPSANRSCLLGRRRLRLVGRAGAEGPRELLAAHRPALERVVAGGQVVARERAQQRRLDVAVAALEAGTARVEDARGRRVHRRGHVAAEDDPLASRRAAVQLVLRHRREQRGRVRVTRMLVQALRGADLEDPAEVHDGDPVGDLPDHREVGGDEDVREPELALEVLEQVEDLRLDGDVEGGDRLVADDQLRLERERARDADALALTAGELVRVAVVVLGVQADALEQLLHAPLAVLLRVVDRERLRDDLPHALPRVERRVRILEDDLHLAADRPQRALAEMGDVAPVEPHDARGRLEQPDDEARGRRLAATRLADDPERLAAAHGQGDVLDRVHDALRPREHALLHREVLRQVHDLDERLLRGRELRHGHAVTPSSAAIRVLQTSRLRSGARWQASRWPPGTGASGGRTLSQGSKR